MVVFLGWQEAGPIDVAPIDPQGTGFFAYQNGDVFLVTAKHVAEKLVPPFVARVNKKDGGADLIRFDRPSDVEWCVHDDSTVDIAVAPIKVPSWADFHAWIVGDESEHWKEIDAGSAVCVVGLYHMLFGRRENRPITHVGHIAMLPKDDLIPVDGILREGYLVGANAISGCSGSPVFAVGDVRLNIADGGIIGHHTKAVLLGIWSASWKVRASQVVAVREDEDGSIERLAPLGMGIVTPVQKLLDIMGGEKLKAATERRKQKITQSKGPTFDSAPSISASPTNNANPNHREDSSVL
jgi:hypothetical protein